MTIPQILTELEANGRPHGVRQLYRRIERLNIEPVGVRQIPQHYPEDTADRILHALGALPPLPVKAPAKSALRASHILSMQELKRAKRKGGRK